MAIAEHHFNCKTYVRALELVQQFISANENSAEAYALLGKCYGELGKANDQIMAFKRSLQLNDNQPNLWSLLIQLREDEAIVPIEFVKVEVAEPTEPESAESSKLSKNGKPSRKKGNAKAIKRKAFYPCDYPGCDFKSQYKFNVNRHIHSEHGLLDSKGLRYQKWYICPTCPERSLVKKNMQIHAERKHGDVKKYKLIVKKLFVNTN